MALITSSSRRALVALSLCASFLAVARPSHASQEYPADLEAYWQIKSKRLPVPGMGCRLCHQSDDGGIGTATQPFGNTMRAHGVKGADPQSLYPALQYVGQHAFTAPIVDSDGDGVPDYTEVAVDFTNPNDPASFVQHMTEPPPSGGAGGDSGGEDAGGAGGQGALQQPSEPPVFEPPSAADLPPTFVHGCATAPAASHRSFVIAALAGALALVRRRRRRHS